MTSRDLMTEADAAQYIGMSPAFLRMDRLRGHVGGRTPGPPYLKLGRSVRYQRSDLDSWLDTRRVDRGARATA